MPATVGEIVNLMVPVPPATEYAEVDVSARL